MKPHRLPLLLGSIWIALIALGLAGLYTYDARPGVAARAPSRWPEGSHVEIARGRPTLVMFLHPRCSCSRASLANLSELLARNRSVVAYVVFSLPATDSAGWTDTDLYRAAHGVDGLRVISDHGGVECRRFGAATSGQTMLFDRRGCLAFSGGITAGRSEFGDNAGSDAISAMLASGHALRRSTPVFGCSLVNDGNGR